MTRVWDEAPFEKTTLLILLCMADHANDEGVCWPAIPTLAKKARCSERWARDIVAELEQKGWLERDLRPGRATMYKVLFPPTPEPQFTPEDTSPLKQASPPPRNPTSGDPGTPVPMNHKEPPSQPSSTKKRSSKKPKADPADDGLFTVDESPVDGTPPEDTIAKKSYDATKGALAFMAVRGIAKWAIHTKGEDPARVEEAIAQLYRTGRSVTKASVGQWLDGHIKPPGQGRPSRMDQNLSVVEQLRLEEQTRPAGAGRQLTAGGRP